MGNVSTASAVTVTAVPMGASPISSSIAGMSTPGPWRTKLSNAVKNSIIGTPIFNRRKFSAGNHGTTANNNAAGNLMTMMDTDAEDVTGGGGGGGGLMRYDSNEYVRSVRKKLNVALNAVISFIIIYF
jgi:hypothetical protein